jgi:hypothetical protein
MFLFFLLHFIQGVLRFNLVVLGVYSVQGQTHEEFVATAVQVEMQCRHFYITRHATKATNAAVAYRAKHVIVDTDMG